MSEDGQILRCMALPGPSLKSGSFVQSCAGQNFSVQESGEPWGSVAQDCTKELTWLDVTPSIVRRHFAGSFAFPQCTRDVPLVNLGWTTSTCSRRSVAENQKVPENRSKAALTFHRNINSK